MTTTTEDKVKPMASDQLPTDKLMDMLYQMMLIRRFEERTMQAYQQAKIGGFLPHLHRPGGHRRGGDRCSQG